ncbi:MAG: hypothetical protein LBI18_03260 [Planctomycetaceae bacterium]|nr:hypothetical protein [Planctomycetaceae bacterium]
MKTILYFILFWLVIFVAASFGQECLIDYVKSLPDAPMSSEVPESHRYKIENHNGMCVACAVTQAGEKMLEYHGKPNECYVIAWTHFAGRNIETKYTKDQIGMYGSDAALAIEQIGFLPASVLEGVDKNIWNNDKVSKLDYQESDWEFFYNKYKHKADKYPVAFPTNVNEIALCLSKGLPVLFLSSAQWKLISWRNVDGKGSNRFEFATTQYNTKEAHVVCLRDYFTLPYHKDDKSYPMEYCNLVNSHGEFPSPLKMIWLDKIQNDHKFSCFVILPKKIRD